MKQLFACLIFCLPVTTISAQSSDIRQTLLDFNHAISNKEVEKAFSVFDDHSSVILAGSDAGELHKGNDAIRKFIAQTLSQPFRVSWDMSNMTIDQNDETAWAFVEGSVTIKQDTGEEDTRPYRMTVVMVKKDKQWKWRLFNGSVPQAE